MGQADAAPKNAKIDWRAVIAADTLVNDPPKLVEDLKECLGHLQRFGLLDGIFDQF